METILEPDGDGVQYFKIRVTAYDAGNKSTSREFVVRLDNRKPRIVDFRVQPFPLPPTLPYEMEQETGYLKTIRDWCGRQNPPIPNCQEPYAALPDPVERRPGRHKYKMALTAFPNAGVGLLVSFRAEEDYAEQLTAQATFTDTKRNKSTDGGTIIGDSGTFRSTYTDLPAYREDGNGKIHPDAVTNVRVQLTVSDGEATVTEAKPSISRSHHRRYSRNWCTILTSIMMVDTRSRTLTKPSHGITTRLRVWGMSNGALRS